MDLFENLNDISFLNNLKKVLKIESLVETSVNLSDELKEECNSKYTRQCCLDFSGVAASLLIEGDCSEAFERVIKSIPFFNKRGIRLHFRFMLVYPFSAHALSRIQAETSRNRTTISQQSLKGAPYDVVGSVESVDYDTFKYSNFVKSQRTFLNYIGAIMHEYHINQKSENRITIRFTPTAVNVCMYRINDAIFISPYLLAKEKRIDDKCVLRAPVIKINRTNDRDSFEAYLDHFRYLWNLPQSIYLEDGTEFTNKSNPNGISIIKPPHKIDYKIKSRRIKQKSGKNNSISTWRFQATDLLLRLCPEVPKKLQAKESIFIACAWRKIDHYLKSSPNTLAKKLERWFKEDLKDSIDIHIVETEPGEDIAKKIYTNLDASTAGIILLTCDVKINNGRYYAKPNIYHELGYLMGRCDQYGDNKRVIPVIQSMENQLVEVPSNINNKASIFFKDDKIDAVYKDILLSVYNVLSIDIETICAALRSHLDRVSKSIEDNAHAIYWAESIRETIKNLHSDECNTDDCLEICKKL